MSLLDGTDARTRARKRKLPAAMVAHQFKPGQVANPLGAAAGKSKCELYRVARAKTLAVVPEMIERQIELAHSSDERVAVIATNSLLDRAGLKPIDKPEFDDDNRPRFDPSLLTPAELRQLEAALRLYVKAMVAPEATPEESINGTRG